VAQQLALALGEAPEFDAERDHVPGHMSGFAPGPVL
jgi:hypothetical protein